MIPLWRETGYRFDFDEARRVERIHLQGARPGDTVGLFRKPYSPESLATVSGIVEQEGWARLDKALITAPGDKFIAIVTPEAGNSRIGTSQAPLSAPPREES